MKIRELLESVEDYPNINNPNIQHMFRRGGHTHTLVQPAPTHWNRRTEHKLTLHPKGGTPYEYKSGRTNYYNPNISDLQTFDAGVEYIEHTHPVLKQEHTDEIEPLGPGIIYRGMSHEEYEFFLRSGKIESAGDYNIGDQQVGLTYWATDPKTAISYANSFAPPQHKPTFLHPAYVMATKMPQETRRVKGTGEHEIGVARPIIANEIVGIWQGTVYDYTPPSYTVFKRSDDSFDTGSGSHPIAQLTWKRIR